MIRVDSEQRDMVSEGETAPTFTASLANGEVGEFDLSAAVADGPVILAFFPGAFTSVCSHEMNTFQDRLAALSDTGATLYGVSVDSPFTLNEFRDKLGLEFDLVSDANRDVIEQYDIVTGFEQYGIDELAERAVFVIDESGTVTYAWVGDNPGLEPDYDEVEEAAAAAAN